MNLEDDLRRAFRRQPAPPDFAERVLARAERGDAPRGAVAPFVRRAPGRMPVMRWLAAAAVVTLMVAGSAQYYEYQQNVAEAKRVEAEIRLAMRITSDTLALVQAKLRDRTR